jgi:hypothetical protein
MKKVKIIIKRILYNKLKGKSTKYEPDRDE